MTIMLIMASVLKGVCFVLLIGITSVFGLHVLFIPAILTFFTSPGLHTTYVSGVLYFWTHLVSVSEAIKIMNIYYFYPYYLGLVW